MCPRPRNGVAIAVAGDALSACASLPRNAPPGVAPSAAAARSYSATLRVTLRGPELRARTGALLAFVRPDRLRVEVPGPSGARFVAVTSGGRLLAVFPAERAVFRSSASALE